MNGVESNGPGGFGQNRPAGSAPKALEARDHAEYRIPRPERVENKKNNQPLAQLPGVEFGVEAVDLHEARGRVTIRLHATPLVRYYQ